MHYHITLTDRCNLRCVYCYGKSMDENETGESLNKKFQFDFSCPSKLNIDLEQLKKFLLQDPHPYLIFYGGEPLLEYKKIMEIIDLLKDTNVKFRMQTNGILLNLLPKEYLNKIGKILISIDGDEKTTDKNRGKGTYKRVIQNIINARNSGYNGEIVARMTISQENPEIHPQINHLLNLIDKGIFDSIHWQLDAGFYESDFEKKRFSKFIEDYNTSITHLIRFWIETLQKGKFYRLYPFIGIIDSFLKNEKTLLRCGAGHSGHCIGTDGKIYACPITPTIKDFQTGTIHNSPSELKQMSISGRCLNCKVLDICGGRCLYSNKANLWPDEGERLICKSITHLIKELQKITPKIESLIKNGKIKKTDFEYEKYFGPEIIP